MLFLLFMGFAYSSELVILDNNFVQGYLIVNKKFELDVSISGGSTFSNQTISITLDPSGCLSGVTTKISDSGTANIRFIDLKIMCEGNFTFIASADIDFDPGASKVVEAKEDTRVLLIQLGQSEFDADREFTVTLSVLSNLSKELWPEDVLINFESSLEMECEESFPLLLKAYIPWTVHCTIAKTGKTTLRLTNVNKTTESVIKIVKVVGIRLSIDYMSKTEEITSDDTLSISVKATFGEKYILSTDYSYPVKLILICQSGEECSGTKLRGGGSAKDPVNTHAGYANFTYVTVLSHGYFQICPMSSNENENEFDNEDGRNECSDLFYSTNKVGYVDVRVSKTKVSAFQYLGLNISVLGEDGGEYFQDSSVSLDEILANGRSLMGGENDGKIKIEARTNLTDAQIYFEGYGNKKVRARVDYVVGYSETITVEPIEVTVYNISKPYPETIRDPFEFDVEVRYPDGSLIENIEVPITISTTPSTDYEGETEYKTKKGRAHISEFYVQSGGSYRLKVAAGDSTGKSEKKYTVEDVDCGIGYGPVIAMILLLVIGLIFPCCALGVDSKVQGFTRVPLKVLAIHPVSGLCFKQPNYRRAILLLHIAACELLMLTLIGAIYGYYDTPTTHYNKSFDDYKNVEVYKGATGWALSQVVGIPLFYFNFKAADSIKVAKISSGVMLLLLSLCTGAIIGMTVKYCLGYFVFWIVNFMVFLLFDFLFAQVIYSFICLCFMSEMVKLEMESPLESKDHRLNEEREDSNRL